MPFNSDSYYRNKYRREAREAMERARAIKAEPINEIREQIRPGYKADEIRFAVDRARFAWRMYLSQCRIIALKRK